MGSGLMVEKSKVDTYKFYPGSPFGSYLYVARRGEVPKFKDGRPIVDFYTESMFKAHHERNVGENWTLKTGDTASLENLRQIGVVERKEEEVEEYEYALGQERLAEVVLFEGLPVEMSRIPENLRAGVGILLRLGLARKEGGTLVQTGSTDESFQKRKEVGGDWLPPADSSLIKELVSRGVVKKKTRTVVTHVLTEVGKSFRIYVVENVRVDEGRSADVWVVDAEKGVNR